jgi:hypothetical protein
MSGFGENKIDGATRPSYTVLVAVNVQTISKAGPHRLEFCVLVHWRIILDPCIHFIYDMYTTVKYIFVSKSSKSKNRARTTVIIA